jgi:hypothetical protein
MAVVAVYMVVVAVVLAGMAELIRLVVLGQEEEFVLYGQVTHVHSHQQIQEIYNESLYRN